jgi:5'-nucleotidase (lipoprotein e(P4) family)
MSRQSSLRSVRVAAVAGIAGLVIGLAVSSPPRPVSAQAPAAVALRDTHENLQGVLWMQTSGEYWANATLVYGQAKRALDAALKDTHITAAVEQTGDFRKKPPAVILDLDETVLDNSKFQGQMVAEHKFYDQDRWNDWVKAQRATAVPGAVDFLRYAVSKKVAVFFVTNRLGGDAEAATIANLRALSIAASPDTVLSSGENGWTSDKSPRRTLVAANHRIVALIGDDLNDFVSMAGMTATQRLDSARANEAKWGKVWFILPNAMYGGWDRALYPGINADADILTKKRSAVQGF